MPSETLVLGFDTSAAHCAAALLLGDRVLETRIDEMAKGQVEHLMPMLEALLARHGYGWGDLGALGVGTGPGNFTGIRIAVSCARGLALSLGIPAIGVSALEAAAEGLPRPCTVLQDAKRGEVYQQSFAQEISAPCLMPLADLSPLGADVAVTGTAAAAAVAQGLASRVTEAALPLPEAIARIAAARHAGLALTGPLARPAPLYLRAADAAPPADPAPVILP
ncbi:tRNA (adenosine(37)-N6)-threonylcarbamoyltransferase complex dimerization subunit type 1 TsaB [Phaeovulum sp. W22_SRMD_FR3]|uniref:tRNA (adenosine(37)-N6)-threonylcarbamoyltransferase complex dimerization subunit type 1 TsaB n=1 Tax=Phaeovulum sp. W22_SRMD_FR3 TaxID=3240274 RepID=UPI003F94E771